MNIAQLFQTTADRHAGRTVLTAWRARSVSRVCARGLENKAALYAAKLQAAGLQPGAAVLVFYPMSVELYGALLAIFQLGLVAMFIDPSAGREHLEQCCALHPPQALIASPKAHLLRLSSPALRRIPHKFVLGFPTPGAQQLEQIWPSWISSWALSMPAIWRVLCGDDASTERSENSERTLRQATERKPNLQAQQERLPGAPGNIVTVADDHPALITFTSGSTGQPKATLRTHGFLQAQHRVLEKSLHLTPGDIDLTTLPIFVIANLASGVHSVIPNADLRFPGAIDPAPVVRQIELMNTVSTAASPALLERLADYCWRQKLQLGGLQKIFTGGAPVFPRLLDQLQRIAPNAKIVAVYGSTEAEPIAKIAWEEIVEADRAGMRQGRGLLAGRPVTDIQLRIMRDQWGTPITPLTQAQFDAACLASQEPGEIVVAGDHVLTSYLHGRGDEETKFKVENTVWHRTGDAGYLDAQGRLWLLGRCAAKVVDARGTLYPFAVECAAAHYPCVKRAALVQHQHRRVLAVELQPPGGDLNDLRDLLAWANIDEIRVLSAIPVDKRHNAKVEYPALAKLLG